MGLKEIIENNPLIIFSTIAIAAFGTGYKIAQGILKRRKDDEINNLTKNISTKVILLDTETLRERIFAFAGLPKKITRRCSVLCAGIAAKQKHQQHDLSPCSFHYRVSATFTGDVSESFMCSGCGTRRLRNNAESTPPTKPDSETSAEKR